MLQAQTPANPAVEDIETIYENIQRIRKEKEEADKGSSKDDAAIHRDIYETSEGEYYGCTANFIDVNGILFPIVTYKDKYPMSRILPGL